jgi:dihydroxyacetone kinase-like protein
MNVTKAQILQWLTLSAEVMQKNKQYLTDLDSAIGDADHGINMARGFKKVLERLPAIEDKDIGNILKAVGMALISSVGGASGPLYGTFFMRAAVPVMAKEELSNEDMYNMLAAGLEGIISRGRAALEDKTMVDAWTPAIAALKAANEDGKDIVAAMTACVAACEQGVQDTIPMLAKKGRASYLGERSIGHQDPGATSTYLLLNALLETISQ